MARHRQRQGVRRRARRARLYAGEGRPPRFLRDRPGGRRAQSGAAARRREGERRARAYVRLDRDSLPTVAEARAAQRETRRERTEALKVEKPALAVLNGATGAADKLTDFVSSLLSGDSKPSPVPAHVDPMQQIKAQRKAIAALENIRDSMERGERLRASDIQNLTPNHLQNIARNGDDYLRRSSNAWSAGASVNAIGGGSGNGNGFPPTSRR